MVHTEASLDVLREQRKRFRSRESYSFAPLLNKYMLNAGDQVYGQWALVH